MGAGLAGSVETAWGPAYIDHGFIGATITTTVYGGQRAIEHGGKVGRLRVLPIHLTNSPEAG